MILSHDVVDDVHRFVMEISGDLSWFRGHFPGQPVLPGVVQLRWAVELSQQHFGMSSGPGEVMRLKFKSVVSPPAVVELRLTRRSPTIAEFAYTGDGREYSQGKLVFNEPSQ